MDWDKVLEAAKAEYILRPDGIHGVNHWLRVAEIGAEIARRWGHVDPDVVRSFALLHDCKRIYDGGDENHGARAAARVPCFKRTAVLELDKTQSWQLTFAMRLHTAGLIETVPTIQACWDADRLDLMRFGWKIDTELLSNVGEALIPWVAGKFDEGEGIWAIKSHLR